MIHMRMGDQHMTDALAFEARQQRIDVGRVIRPRVDHYDITRADHVRSGAVQRIGRGVAGDDAPHTGRDRREFGILKGDVAIELQCHWRCSSTAAQSIISN